MYYNVKIHIYRIVRFAFSIDFACNRVRCRTSTSIDAEKLRREKSWKCTSQPQSSKPATRRLSVRARIGSNSTSTRSCGCPSIVVPGRCGRAGSWSSRTPASATKPGCSAPSGRPAGTHEGDRARRIACVRIGREVMIERAVLVEDHHEMLDRRLRMNVMRMTMVAIPATVVVTTEIVGENRNAARKCRRSREIRSRRQKFGFHLCLPRRSDGVTVAVTFDRAVSV